MLVETQDLIDTPSVMRELGKRHEKIRYAVLNRKLVEPLRIGKYWFFSREQVDVLKKHFEN